MKFSVMILPSEAETRFRMVNMSMSSQSNDELLCTIKRAFLRVPFSFRFQSAVLHTQIVFAVSRLKSRFPLANAMWVYLIGGPPGSQWGDSTFSIPRCTSATITPPSPAIATSFSSSENITCSSERSSLMSYERIVRLPSARLTSISDLGSIPTEGSDWPEGQLGICSSLYRTTAARRPEGEGILVISLNDARAAF